MQCFLFVTKEAKIAFVCDKFNRICFATSALAIKASDTLLHVWLLACLARAQACLLAWLAHQLVCLLGSCTSLFACLVSGRAGLRLLAWRLDKAVCSCLFVPPMIALGAASACLAERRFFLPNKHACLDAVAHVLAIVLLDVSATFQSSMLV